MRETMRLLRLISASEQNRVGSFCEGAILREVVTDGFLVAHS